MSDSKGNKFDTFTPFQSVTMRNFEFRPSMYEVWQGGNMISSGKFDGVIYGNILDPKSKQINIYISSNSVNMHISNNFNFSISFTQKDRIQLAEIPPAKSTDCNGLSSLRMVTGNTCEEKFFSQNEPYCSGLFLNNGNLDKMTFSFNSPVKLIEFYK